ncbi:MAG: fumarylacetoacetate hydrolase family protein [Ignavibacteriaceae bacterium]
MKLITYKQDNSNPRVGIFYNNLIFDVRKGAEYLKMETPSFIGQIIEQWEYWLNELDIIFNEIKSGRITAESDREHVEVLAPLPHPNSCRDAYAFRQHVETARRNRGADMIPEFDQFPVFYFTNHNAIFGEGDIIVEEDHLQKLDFELEAAVIIGKKGKNISAKDADSYIAGYTIMNDLSARKLQMEEMKLNLGPAKGKDFATVIGPYLVTTDELEKNKINTSSGNKYDLKMTAKHNGKLISEGNLKDMNWTFAEIIERASYGVELYPGDVIGSGTVGTGCYLELNGTKAMEAKKKGEEFTSTWLKEGDTIELEIEELGKLKNKIVKAKNSYSILAKKKNS